MMLIMVFTVEKNLIDIYNLKHIYMSKGKALLGVLAGLAAGAVLGVLFAPEKGSRTRKRISNKTEDLVDAMGDQIERKFNEVIRIVDRKMEKATSQLKDTVAAAKAELVD